MSARSDDAVALAELRKWLKTRHGWVFASVLEQLEILPRARLHAALSRLRSSGLAEHEARVGHRGGAWRATSG